MTEHFISIEDFNTSWSTSPPEGKFPSPPINSNLQTLPYSELTWENFERLIRRLVEREATVSQCWLYGTPGQAQFGLDILALGKNVNDKFSCYQCKRVKDFTDRDITQAVDKFISGKFSNKTSLFVLCTSIPLNRTEQVDAIVIQQKRLAEKGIAFEVWDASEGGLLSEKLKKLPELVDDFFLRSWVKLFNGETAAQKLGDRLDGLSLDCLRSQLKEVYSTLFQRHDPGLRLNSSQRPASLLQRYIVPAVNESRTYTTREHISEQGSEFNTIIKDSEYHKTGVISDNGDPDSSRNSRLLSSVTQDLRLSLEEWFTKHNRSVVLGEPGYGKSTLLRVMALQILTKTKGMIPDHWNRLLPVWVSFGGYSTAIQKNPSLSIEDYFDNWLHQNSADEIRPLFKRAVKQGELLLLVDGLDEGNQTESAVQAMDRISSFLVVRSLPAVFTSRPRGYERLRPDGTWPIVRLAAFDESQIALFAHMWFDYLESISSNRTLINYDNIKQRTDDFLKATRVNSRIIELARTPLFCQLLIEIFRYSHHLPEQRIKVYEKIIDLLLNDHPEARLHAAGLQEHSFARKEDMREMLMRLALQIQESEGAGVVTVESCQHSFSQFLMDDINGPGLTPYDAKYQAKSVINYALSGLGLMVERSPKELGFFHLTLQEYLAAQCMIREEESVQLDWLTRVWHLPKWREVILAWFSIRGGDQGKNATQRAIDYLKERSTTPWTYLQLLILRTEIAVHDLGFSPREARATINEAVKEIETTPFDNLRVKLAGFITQGLSSTVVGQLCSEHILNWLPANPEWARIRILRNMHTWEPEEDLLSALFKAMYDQDLNCQFAAAETLAGVFQGETEVELILVDKAQRWAEVSVRAAALYALELGWPKSASLPSLVESASLSTNPLLFVTSIAIRIRMGNQREQDRNMLWEYFINDSFIFNFPIEIDDLLIKGWGKDDYLINSAIKELTENRFSGFRKRKILTYLLNICPDNKKLESLVIGFINTNFASFLHHTPFQSALLRAYTGNSVVISSLQNGMDNSPLKLADRGWGKEFQFLSLMIGTNTEKSNLLQRFSVLEDDNLNVKEKFWLLDTLIKGWPDDGEVKRLIISELRKPPQLTSYMANWVKDYITNDSDRKAWLNESLKTDLESTLGMCIAALIREFPDNSTLVSLLDLHERIDNKSLKSHIKIILMKFYPLDSTVKKWVSSSLISQSSLELESIAFSHKSDPVVRKKLLSIIHPATIEVRAEVFRVLREHPIEPSIARKFTELAFVEDEGPVRTSGIIAHCMAVRSDAIELESFLSRIKNDFHSMDVYYESKMRSAFTALLFLDKYDDCVQLLSGEGNYNFSLTEYHVADTLATRIMIEKWDKLRDALNMIDFDFSEFWEILIYNGTAQEALITPSTRVELASVINDKERNIPLTLKLELAAQIYPSSLELRNELISVISDLNIVDAGVIAEAQRLYAEHFSGDPEALSELDFIWSSFGLDNQLDVQKLVRVIFALIIGWPESRQVKYLLSMENRPKLPIYIVLALSRLNHSNEKAFECIKSIQQETHSSQSIAPRVYLDTLRNWAITPNAVEVLDELNKDVESSSKLTAMALFDLISQRRDANRIYMIEHFNKSMTGEISMLDGTDIFLGKIVTFAQAIAARYLMPSV